MTTKPTPGVRYDARTGQFVPTVNGIDQSPTTFEADRALEIARQICDKSVQGEVKDLDNSLFARLGSLIAAAPDLLRCLGVLVKMVEDGDWTTIELDEARAAIKAAQGETPASTPKLPGTLSDLAWAVGAYRAAISDRDKLRAACEWVLKYLEDKVSLDVGFPARQALRVALGKSDLPEVEGDK